VNKSPLVETSLTLANERESANKKRSGSAIEFFSMKESVHGATQSQTTHSEAADFAALACCGAWFCCPKAAGRRAL
jgi:hypothetical protein